MAPFAIDLVRGLYVPGHLPLPACNRRKGLTETTTGLEKIRAEAFIGRKECLLLLLRTSPTRL
jgi:hypothetical protein